MCELSWDMMILGVDGVWGRDCLFSPFHRVAFVGQGGWFIPSPSPPKNCLALAISPLPPVPPCGVVVRGQSPQAPGRPGEASFKARQNKIHLDCTLLFIAYFVLSVVDNSLLSYIKKYLNAVQCAMPRAGVVKAIGGAARRSLGSSWF